MKKNINQGQETAIKESCSFYLFLCLQDSMVHIYLFLMYTRGLGPYLFGDIVVVIIW